MNTFTFAPTIPDMTALRAQCAAVVNYTPVKPAKLSAKQRDVLQAFAQRADGIYVNESYFRIGRSNGKMSAALCLERKGLVARDERNPQLLRITEAGREALGIPPTHPEPPTFTVAPATPPIAALRQQCAAAVNYTPAECSAMERSVAEKRAAEIAYPYPPVAPPCHPLTALLSNPDASDSALLDSCYGVEVVFTNPCIAGRYPRQQMTGVIVGLETWVSGVRMLQVKAAELNVPKWIELGRVQFVTESEAS